MSDEKMRAEFELAYENQYRRKPQTWLGAYRDAHTNGAWWAWQVSRKAVCVELPKRISEDEDWPSDCWNNAITYCERALDKAGVSYK